MALKAILKFNFVMLMKVSQMLRRTHRICAGSSSLYQNIQSLAVGVV
jgi:hypothetical protein